MRFSLVDGFTPFVVRLFFIVIIFVVSVKCIGVIPEHEIFICLFFLQFFRVIPQPGLMTRIFLLELRLVIGVTVGVSHREVDFLGIG